MSRLEEHPTGRKTESRRSLPPLDLENLVRTCPNCSATLEESRCKLLCPRCHYYMSCSDYY
jgi:hypothetical protein